MWLGYTPKNNVLSDVKLPFTNIVWFKILGTTL